MQNGISICWDKLVFQNKPVTAKNKAIWLGKFRSPRFKNYIFTKRTNNREYFELIIPIIMALFLVINSWFFWANNLINTIHLFIIYFICRVFALFATLLHYRLPLLDSAAFAAAYPSIFCLVCYVQVFNLLFLLITFSFFRYPGLNYLSFWKFMQLRIFCSLIKFLIFFVYDLWVF